MTDSDPDTAALLRCHIYGLRMLKFSASADTARISRRMKGDAKLPEDAWRFPDAVAMKEAKIRLKFIRLKLVGKCFCP